MNGHAAATSACHFRASASGVADNKKPASDQPGGLSIANDKRQAALPSNADIHHGGRQAADGPEPDTHIRRNSFSLWRGSNDQPISSLPVTSRPIVVI
jgi:hypothetical protein